MVAWTETSGDITSASTALAGLLLVFLGSVSAAFGSYEKVQQRAVAAKFKTRGLLALLGFVFSLLAASFSIGGKLLASPSLIITSLSLLGLAIVPVVIVAILTTLEIK